MPINKKAYSVLACILCLLSLAGCVAYKDPGYNQNDPIEPFNRTMFSFNEGLDKVILKPVSKGYSKIVPEPAKTSVSNFFNNFSDFFSAIPNFLSGHFQESVNNLMRFSTNSTLGLFGLFDVATDAGLPQNKSINLGITIGRWGISEGPFLMLPFLGPKTSRGLIGEAIVSTYISSSHGENNIPFYDFVTIRDQLGGALLNLISIRASLLPADQIISQAALDKYSYIRDAYRQHEHNLVNPKKKSDEDEVLYNKADDFLYQ